MLRKIVFCLPLTLFLLTVAEAQQPMKIPKIGLLLATSPSVSPARVEAFRRGLRELGYQEGKNIVIEYRYAEGQLDRLPALASELVRLKVDVIVTTGGLSTRAAKKASAVVPVVMTQDIDPVANGFIASLARPGGNITGLCTLGPEISGKQLELLKEIVSKFSRVAVLGTTANQGYAQVLREIGLAAEALECTSISKCMSPKEIDSAFRAARKGRAEAVLVLVSGPVFNSQRAQIVALAMKNRLPAIYDQRAFVEAGGLVCLRRKLYRFVSSRRYLCRQDTQRREACRTPRRAANEV